jgi:hypothetical protein
MAAYYHCLLLCVSNEEGYNNVFCLLLWKWCLGEEGNTALPSFVAGFAKEKEGDGSYRRLLLTGVLQRRIKRQ